MQNFLFLALTSFVVVSVEAQVPETKNRRTHRIQVESISESLQIDGRLDEAVWQIAERAGDFIRVLPIDTGQAEAQTDVMVARDATHFYFAIICYDPTPGNRPAESLRRDFSFGRNDNFLIFMDTYNDQTNGFSFGTSAAGAQWDGLQADGGFVNLNWDCKWRSAVSNEPDKWIAEYAIPFRSIKYQEGATEWGINFSRLDLKTGEKSSWAPVPRQFQTANLAFTGALVWDAPPPKLSTRFSVIPYLSMSAAEEVEAGESTDLSGDAGLDIKATIGTSLSLDVTVNPDFSQVEVDQQVTNLQRFELFFPEKRQFFLDNSDLFASLGSEELRPFFSRRIGLESPVQAGFRLSGNLNENWRVGLMNMQTGTKGDIPASNFSVVTLQRRVFGRSNLSGFFINKSLTGDITSDQDAFRYNRTAGLDFNLASNDDTWSGKAFYHHSFYPGSKGDAFTLSTNLEYNIETFRVAFEQATVGSGYRADVGFVPRTGFHFFKPEVEYAFFPESEKLANHGPSISLDIFYDKGWLLTDREVELEYALSWLDRSEFSVAGREIFVRLDEPFDPTNKDGDTLATGSTFSWWEYELAYSSNARRLFTYDLKAEYGGFFNGDRIGFSGTMNYRVQPFGSIGVASEFNRLILPSPFENTNLFLIGPRLDITFTDNLFLTTFVQWNNQIDNLNVNIRFQWRFAPVSDFFLVYTDNSYPDNFRTKNRQLVAKLSYWIN